MTVEVSQPVVFRGDLSVAYFDPGTAPGVRAYIPEAHASAACHRALPKGSRAPVASDPIWCEACTCTRREDATMTRAVDGSWALASDG